MNRRNFFAVFLGLGAAASARRLALERLPFKDHIANLTAQQRLEAMQGYIRRRLERLGSEIENWKAMDRAYDNPFVKS